MYQSKKVLTGIIINAKKQKIAFVAEGFRFTFVNTDMSLAGIDLTPDSAGYIWGSVLSADGAKIIAISVREPVTVWSGGVFNTWNYIVMNIRMSVRDDGTFEFPGFQGIRFMNGSVMSVNPPWALHEDREKENELNEKLSEAPAVEQNFSYSVYRKYNNAKKFTIHQEECSIEWIFGSEINSKMSFDKGSSLENNKSVLEIRFSEDQALQTFYNYYGYVTTLLGFLTFREAAPFEEIGLLHKHPQYGFNKFADCYVNTSINILANDSERKDEKQIRGSMNSISVHLLSDDAFVNMIQSIIGTEKKNVVLPTAIIPRDNRDVGMITPEKIKSICSALEVEMDAAGIKRNKGDELEKLITDVKDVIKKHRESENNELPSKTYDNIYNSISHWGASLADRAIEAWNQNEAFLNPWLQMLGISVLEKDIAAVVKARNDITHRGFQNIDEKIAQTAFAMSGIIYVLALKRLKVSDEVIKDLMDRKIVG